MNARLELPDELLIRLEQRVTASVADQLGCEFATRWLNVDGAADYLATTTEAFAPDLTFEHAVRLDRPHSTSDWRTVAGRLTHMGSGGHSFMYSSSRPSCRPGAKSATVDVGLRREVCKEGPSL